MNYFLFGTGLLTGGLITFLISRIKILREGLKKEAFQIEEKEFYRTLSQQTDLSIYKNTIDLIERERERISADIHDDMAQSLSALFLDLDRIVQESVKVSPELTNSLVNVSTKLETVIDTLREIIYCILPADLINRNLTEAIDELCKRYNNIKGTQIRFESVGEERILPQEYSLNIYRIIQELLNNCKKHSQASLCFVKLFWSDKELKLIVFDTGVGLKDSIRKSDQFGIRGIFARCRAMNVLPQFNVPGKGLEFALTLPL